MEFFTLFASWWGFITSIRYLRSKPIVGSKNELKTNKFKSSVTMPFLCLNSRRLRKFPFESIFKCLASITGLVMETINGLEYQSKNTVAVKTPNLDNHVHKRFSNGLEAKTLTFDTINSQHIVIYAAFLMSSIIELLIHYNVDLPEKFDYAITIVAFYIEYFVMTFHLHGKEPVDAHIHVLLAYSILGCVIFWALEACDPTQVLLVYGRILFVLLQGTWFLHNTLLLYVPGFKMDLNNHENIMLVTVYFCWHILLDIIVILIQYWCVKKFLFASAYISLKDELEDTNEMRFLTLETDSDNGDRFINEINNGQK